MTISADICHRFFIPAKRKQFEQKRKKHYNEFYAVKIARQLMEKDEDNEEEDDEDKIEESPSTSTKPEMPEGKEDSSTDKDASATS